MQLPSVSGLLLSVLLVLISHSPHSSFVLAQYEQDYTWRYIPDSNNVARRTPYWKYGPSYVQGAVLDPAAIVLEYNCEYLRDICQNRANFQDTDRALNRSYPDLFGYQFGKKSSDIKEQRGRRMCPGGTWKRNHPCPETGNPRQRLPMRHDGEWWTRDLEPGTDVNEIAHVRGPGGLVTKKSNIRYTCDEFPPKSFIEGGIGPDSSPEDTEGPGETRCAAMRCGDKGITGVKSEQNWQANSHKEVGMAIRRMLSKQGWGRNNFPGLDYDYGFVMIRLATTTMSNGIAARVISYPDQGNANSMIVKNINQNKRTSNTVDYLDWLNSVTVQELEAMGPLRETRIHANHTHDHVTYVDPVENNGDPIVEVRGLYEAGEETSDAYAQSGANHEAPPSSSTGIDKTEKTMEATREISHPSIRPLFKRASQSDLQKARKIVDAALEKSAKLNAKRYENPLRNRYGLKPGTVVGDGNSKAMGTFSANSEVPALLEVTDEIAEAAALVSEAESTRNETKRAVKVAASGSYWMEHISRKGTVPWGDDPSYKVFRNVVDYGAVGDGVTDDTKAIKNAMSDGKRCGSKCNGSTTKNAIVYFPPGKYMISSTVPVPFGTQIIGDANDWPTLVASRVFVGLGVLSVNEYTGGGTGADGLDQQWYINTANFYRQLRNMKIDITQTRSATQAAGLHYQVAQATSLQNVEIIAAKGTKQRGIFAENGSGGVMSDVTFRGGEFGVYGGEQQFTAQRLKFDGCATAVQIIWDWGWIWKSITMNDVGVGFRLVPEGKKSTVKRQAGVMPEGKIGSISIYDSSFTGVDTIVLITPPSPEPGSGSTGVVIENTSFTSVDEVVADTSGKTILKPSSKIDHWALGPVYSPTRQFSQGERVDGFRREKSLLDGDGNYFERMKPQYEDRSASDFVHVKDYGAKGDGKTDDTAAFQQALYSAQGKILFVDAGSYILTDTVTIPTGSKIVGETWSQLVAKGEKFSDAKDPKAMIKVGRQGEVGDVEMQDLFFTNVGPTAGLIHVEWNIEARSPGSAALWDCHVRVGGATGTELTPEECPALTSGIAKGCNAGSLMMHITSSASGYFENMWLWVADHMIDDPDLNDANNTMVQNSIYVARGLLVESTKPTWLYGTSSEHAVFYQYNFHKAKNVFAGMIQTESPYYQPTPEPPAPFEDAVGIMAGDPNYDCDADDEFSGCDESWALIIRGSSRIMIAGAGMYSWFSTYAQDCIGEQECQKVLMLLEENLADIRIQQIITIGAKYMGVEDGVGIKAIDNLNVKTHPRWSQVSVWDVNGNGSTFDKAVWIDPEIWDMDSPAFTCSPPCYAKIPPWTGATRTVNYPVMTVSSGSWTSRITRAPLTITNLLFEIATLTEGDSNRARKRQPYGEFWPKPITTPRWPVVTYKGPDGSLSTTAPTTAFPKPPASIGPGAEAPKQGEWPSKPIKAIVGRQEIPLVEECSFPDFDCDKSPWEYGDMEGPPLDPDDDDYDENREELKTLCPDPTSSSTTKEKPSSTREPIKVPVPSPMENEKECYGKWYRATDNKRLQNAVHSFCSSIADDGDILKDGYDSGTKHYEQTTGGGELGLEILVWLHIKDKCEWRYTYDECVQYGKVPIDSCDCNGTNGKHGGFVRNNCLEMRVDPNTLL